MDYIEMLREMADKLERESPLAADAIVILRRLSAGSPWHERLSGSDEGWRNMNLDAIVADSQELLRKVDEVVA